MLDIILPFHLNRNVENNIDSVTYWLNYTNSYIQDNSSIRQSFLNSYLTYHNNLKLGGDQLAPKTN